eukprot:11971441-Prorocentrum_lima.AAC.1
MSETPRQSLCSEPPRAPAALPALQSHGPVCVHLGHTLWPGPVRGTATSQAEWLTTSQQRWPTEVAQQ